MVAAQAIPQTERDPHRPPCLTQSCRRIKSFLKAHYCGESPFGNGPDDGCEIKLPTKPGAGVQLLADYHCQWDDTKESTVCEQHGMPSDKIRETLRREMQDIGLPSETDGQTYYILWKYTHSGWLVAMAYYSRKSGTDVELCDVMTMIDSRGHATVLRKVPFQKTDLDVPTVTEWALVDIADVLGDGQDLVLEGDEYENHWLEVVSVRNGSPKTIFSGLGYYL